MSPVYSQCPLCGVFPSPAFRIMNANTVTLKGNRERCPRCGRWAQVLDGTFNFDSRGFARIVTAPDWTREAYAEAHRLLLNAREQLQDGEPEQRVMRDTAKALNKVRPGFGTKLSQMWSSPGTANTLALLTFLVTILGMLTTQGLTEPEVNRLIDQAITHERESRVTDETPGGSGDNDQITDEYDDGEDNKPRR